MPSETFYCPHCKRQLTKSPQAYVLGEAIKSKSGFMGFGDLPKYLDCPGCHGKIDTMKMVKGEYDYNSVDVLNGVAALVVIAAIFVLKFLVHWSWVVAILVGLVGGIMLVAILAELFRGRKKKNGLYD